MNKIKLTPTQTNKAFTAIKSARSQKKSPYMRLREAGFTNNQTLTALEKFFNKNQGTYVLPEVNRVMQLPVESI